MEKFETSDGVFHEFILARYSMQAILVGEKIAEHDNLAKKMKPYLKYKLRRIREWAQWKIEYSNDLINDNKHMEVIKER